MCPSECNSKLRSSLGFHALLTLFHSFVFSFSLKQRGRTALSYAAINRQHQVIAKLAEMKADPNVVDEVFGSSSLTWLLLHSSSSSHFFNACSPEPRLCPLRLSTVMKKQWK